MNIDLDRTKINKSEIPIKPIDLIHDGVGFEYEGATEESRKEMKLKKKGIPQSINLNVANGLGLIERFINKYLGSLVGNNPDPLESLAWLNPTKLNIIYLLEIDIAQTRTNYVSRFNEVNITINKVEKSILSEIRKLSETIIKTAVR